MKMDETALSADTLTGDIRDFLLTFMRGRQKPFEQMTEVQQMDVIEAVETKARHLVGGVIDAISGHGFQRAIVRLGQFTVKDGLEAKLLAPRTERNLLNFNSFAGKNAVLIFADPEEFDGQRAPAKVFKQQRDIEEVIAEASGPAPKKSGPAPKKSRPTPDHDPVTGEVEEEIESLDPDPAPKTRRPPMDDLDPGPLPPGLVRNPNPAKPGTIDPNDPGEPEAVTVNDAAPAINRTSERDPFDADPDD